MSDPRTRSAAWSRVALVAAALTGAGAVALGAWAAHGLDRTLDARALAWVDTGVRYQGLHAVALLGLAGLCRLHLHSGFAAAIVAFGAGIVLFSGSLYALAFTGVRGFAHVAPFGGMAFILGWLVLLWPALDRRAWSGSPRELGRTDRPQGDDAPGNP